MAADPNTPTNSDPASVGDPLIDEARKRWNRCAEWEATARERFIDDLKFRHGDSDNSYQWPNAIKRARDVDAKPCLTINQIRQHNLMIVNSSRQNKSSIKIRPTSGLASLKSAQALQHLQRRIEYQSDAQSVYTLAQNFQVDGGIGWWRICTRYAHNDTFEQEIFIEPVPDPLSIYIDPDCKMPDKSDAQFAFVFDDIPKFAFDEVYPKFKGVSNLAPLGMGSTEGDFIMKGHVRICEYFRKVRKDDVLCEFLDVPSGQRLTLRKSNVPREVWDSVANLPDSRTRDIQPEVVEWKLIVGETLVDETVWPGKYIPLVPCLGEEIFLDGIMDRRGHTRWLKDAQRMYNYNCSSQVEVVALQGKTPWIAPAKAIEELESMWNTANTINHSVLPWNHVDDDGNPIPPPVRAEPPQMSQAYQAGMDTAFQQLMMASGQWQNQMGMMGNERTGAAIDARQAQGDTATFHFQDNYALALRFTGRQIIDLIPRVYDTRRVMRVQGDDGADYELTIDPGSRRALIEELNEKSEIVRRVFNPQVGEYDIEADVGPAYGTRRQETVQALTLILTQAPALTGLIGDLLLSSMDFDKAQEAALRLRRMVPPQALGQGPSQQEIALQTQVQSLSQALIKALDQGAKDKLKLVGKDQMREIDAYKAETDRMKAIGDLLGVDETGLRAIVDQLVKDSMATQITDVTSAAAVGAAQEAGAPPTLQAPAAPGASAGVAPVPGARQAPDGEWYLQDPTRQGKYMRVVPLAQERRPRGVIENA